MRRLSCLFGGLILTAACSGGGEPGGPGGSGGFIPSTSGNGGSTPISTGSFLSSTGASSSGGAAPSPIAGLAIFYTDLESGPNNGGQDDKGAFVTVYGNGFGDTQGTSTVTVGGGAADNYPIWSDKKITLQLGSQTKTGEIVVHVPAKGDSNGSTFTVRSGKIYFSSSSGKSQNDGSFEHPWATIPDAKNKIQAGDIAYLGTSAGDTLSQTTEDASSPYKCALGISTNDGTNTGTADKPKALIAYPGAKVTVGAETGLERGILSPGIDGQFDYWVIAGLNIRGAVEAIDMENMPVGWRVVGNDISCPNGTGPSGCVTGFPDHFKFYGNDVHDAAGNVALADVTKYYHGIYFGGSNHIEIGWNQVRNGHTCRAIQIHDTGGPDNYDILIHDNLIHGTVCDGINLATVDPSQGAVEVYNNVIYDVGKGPDPADGSAIYAGIYAANTVNAGDPGSGNVKVYNNTLFDCGSHMDSDSAAIILADGPVGIEMTNNLILQKSGEKYFSNDTNTAGITGSNNLFFGAGDAPDGPSASVDADPKLMGTDQFDFHLLAGSPAIDAGVTTAAKTDHDGNPRPLGKSFDIGAYEASP